MSYVLGQVYGYHVPKQLAIEVSRRVQAATDATGKELAPSDVLEIFEGAYLSASGRFTLVDYQVEHVDKHRCHVTAHVTDGGKPSAISGEGEGTIDAFVAAVASHVGTSLTVADYSEHAMGGGADAEAAAYVALAGAQQRNAFGVGRDRDIVKASFIAVLRALNALVVS